MEEETRKLLKERQINCEKINYLSDSNRELTNRMCDIESSCPYCGNWHYPHCGQDIEEE